MGTLANISGKQAVKAFVKAGYYVDHQTGSHIILSSTLAGRPPLSIPNHKELAPSLLRSQIKRAGLALDEFIKLLRK